jgi:hypothetical protein
VSDSSARRRLRELIKGLRQETAALEDVERRVDAGEMTVDELDDLLRSYESVHPPARKSPAPPDWRTVPPSPGSVIVDREAPAWEEPAWSAAPTAAPTPPPGTAVRVPLRTSTVISLVGAFLIGASALIFAAVAWKDLGTAARLSVLGVMAGLAGGGTLFAHRKKYQGTAEGMAWLTSAVVAITTGTATAYDVLPVLPGLRGPETGVLANASLALVAICLLLSRLTPPDPGAEVSSMRQPRQLLPFAVLAYVFPLLSESSWTGGTGPVLATASDSVLLLLAFAFVAFPRRESPGAWRLAAMASGALVFIGVVFAAMDAGWNATLGSFAAFATGAAGMRVLYRRREVLGTAAVRLFAKCVVPAMVAYVPLSVGFREDSTGVLSVFTLAASLSIGVGLIVWMRAVDRAALDVALEVAPGFVRAGQVLDDLGVSSLRGIPHLAAMLPAAAGWIALLVRTDVLSSSSPASLLATSVGAALAASVYAGHRVKFDKVRETLPSREPTLPFAGATWLMTLFVAARYAGLDASWSLFVLFVFAALLLAVYVLFHRGIPAFAPSPSLYPMVDDRKDSTGPRVDGTFAVLLTAAVVGAAAQVTSPMARTFTGALVLLVCAGLVSRGVHAALPVGAAALLVTTGLALDLGGMAVAWNSFGLFVLSGVLLTVQIARKPEDTGTPGAVTVVCLVASALSAFASTGRPDTRTYVCAVASVLGWLLVSRGVRAVTAFSFAASTLLLVSTLHWANVPEAWIGFVSFLVGGALAAVAMVRPRLVGRDVSVPRRTPDGVLVVAAASTVAGALLCLSADAPRTIAAGLASLALIVGVVGGARDARLVVAATVSVNLTWFFAVIWAGISNPDLLGAVSGIVSLVGGSVLLGVAPRLRSWVLAPGMVGLLGYSVLETVDDPGNLARWTVSLVGGCVFAGYGLARRFRTPFLVGLSVLVLAVLVQVGPWALDVPRWILLLVVGVVLMAGGARFEKVRSGYDAVEQFVQRMR